MRPRSRLMSKRRLLLPTIREGAEDSTRDVNEGNSLHVTGHGQAVSSDDYLLSIGHLAYPTFPTRDLSTTNTHTQQFDAARHRLRLSRLIGTPSGPFEFNPTGEAHGINVQQGEGKEMDSKIMFGNADPLECLYGHQDNLAGGVSVQDGQANSRAHSTPCDSGPDLPRRPESSFAELYTSTNTNTNISPHSTALPAWRPGGGAQQQEEQRRGDRMRVPSNASSPSGFLSAGQHRGRRVIEPSCCQPFLRYETLHSVYETSMLGHM